MTEAVKNITPGEKKSDDFQIYYFPFSPRRPAGTGGETKIQTGSQKRRWFLWHYLVIRWKKINGNAPITATSDQIVKYHEPAESGKGKKTDIDFSGGPVGFFSVPTWTARIIVLFLVVIFAGQVVFAADLFLNSALNERLPRERAIASQIASTQEEINKYELQREKLSAVEKQLAAVYGVVANHVYWSQLLAALERDTLDNVYYDSIHLNESGEIALAVSARDLVAAAEQVKIWQNDKDVFATVDASSFTAEASGRANKSASVIKFEAKLVLQPQVLLKSIKINDN